MGRGGVCALGFGAEKGERRRVYAFIVLGWERGEERRKREEEGRLGELGGRKGNELVELRRRRRSPSERELRFVPLLLFSSIYRALSPILSPFHILGLSNIPAISSRSLLPSISLPRN